MPDCEECGEEVRRRVWCWHCGRYVCPWCWHHIHGCGPSHTRAECKHYQSYTSQGADSKRIWRAMLRNKLRRDGEIDA
jgi:hypothetical protein